MKCLEETKRRFFINAFDEIYNYLSKNHLKSYFACVPPTKYEYDLDMRVIRITYSFWQRRGNQKTIDLVRYDIESLSDNKEWDTFIFFILVLALGNVRSRNKINCLLFSTFDLDLWTKEFKGWNNELFS